MTTLDDLNEQLLQIDCVIAKTLRGEAVTEFEIGSGSSNRKYKYQEVTLEALQKERARLLGEIAQLTNDEPLFRKSSRMQLLHRKI